MANHLVSHPRGEVGERAPTLARIQASGGVGELLCVEQQPSSSDASASLRRNAFQIDRVEIQGDRAEDRRGLVPSVRDEDGTIDRLTLGASGRGTQRCELAQSAAAGDGALQAPSAGADAGAKRVVARELVMGSSDPHGLRLEDDRAPACAKRPAFAIAAHLPAEAKELATRPLPMLNRAEATEPIPPPPAPLASPPHVTRVNQVVTPKGLALVRTWMRRLRRSLRAAQRGEPGLAKRLRPRDVWLGEEYMVLESRAWNWDLRPLALGEPAIPLAPSGRDGVESPSSFERSELGRDDATFPDQAILSEMTQGVRDDSACRRGTLLCAPHGSALENFAVAEEKIAKGVESGWLSAGWELPCWPLRTAPYGVVDESERAGEPKHRFTNDLSWPHAEAMVDEAGVPVDSLNGAMRREEWPHNRLMRIYEFSAGAAILETSGARVELWGLDVRAYYRAFGRQSGELWRTAFVDASGFTLDERCCFGSAADACKCARVSNYLAWQTLKALRAVDAQYPSREPHVLAWQAERRRLGREAGASEEEIETQWAALHTFGFYIDDGAGASIADRVCRADGSPVMRDGVWLRRSQLHFEAAKGVLRRFGLESAPNKEQPPALEIVSLGIEMDLKAGRMRVSEDKRRKYAAKAEAMAGLKSCSREEMVALLSRLQFAASCYPRGRQWLHAPWRAVRAQWRLANGNVLITKAVSRSLRKWAQELSLERHEGVPLASRTALPWGDGVCAVYADASGEQGWMAWTVHQGELLFADGVWDDAVRELPICDKELLASTWGLVALAPESGARQVMSFTDNTVAQAAMRTQTPSAAAMAHLVERRSEWLLENGCLESVHRITSKANLWADMGSRGETGGVLLQALALGYKPRRVYVEEKWLRLAADAAQIRAAESECQVTADDEGIAGSPRTSGVAYPTTIPKRRERDGEVGESAKPSHPAADEQAADGGLGGSSGRGDEDRSEALAQIQCLRPEHGADTAPRARRADRAEAGGGDAADELRCVAGIVQANRQVHLSRIGEEVRRRGSDVDAEGAFSGVCRRAGIASPARSRERDAARAGRAAEAGALGSADTATAGGNGQKPPAEILGAGAGMEGGAGAGLLHALARWRGGGAERGDVQPATALDAGGYPGGAIERWFDRAQIAIESIEEESDDWEDVLRLPTRGREAHRRGHGGVAVPRDGSRRTRDGEAHTALQAREWRGLPSRGSCGSGEAADGVDRTRPKPIRSAQSSDRRCNGGAGRGDPTNAHQGVGEMELGHLRDLLPALARGGGRDGGADWIDPVRRCGAGGVRLGRSRGDEPRVGSDASRRAGSRVGRGGALSTYVVGGKS